MVSYNRTHHKTLRSATTNNHNPGKGEVRAEPPRVRLPTLPPSGVHRSVKSRFGLARVPSRDVVGKNESFPPTTLPPRAARAGARPDAPAVARASSALEHRSPTMAKATAATRVFASAVALLAAVGSNSASPQEPARERDLFHEVFVWKNVDFEWAHDSDKARALDARLFQPENCAIHAMRVWRDRLFVTLPRWRDGVPATLATLPSAAPHPAPPLQPFPSWEMQTPRNCSAIQSAQAIDVTPEGRLWVLDGGRAPTLDTSVSSSSSICPPKILIYDLDTRNVSASRLWKSFPVPQYVLSRDSAFADMAVDANDVAFISDASDSEPGIVVVDARSGRAWKARDDRSMRGDAGAPAPPPGLAGGVTALALAPSASAASSFDRDSDRVLYFAPLRGQQVFAVNASALRDERVATSTVLGERVVTLGNSSSFSQAMAADDRGVLYLGLNAIHAIARWDASSKTPSSPPQRHVQVIAADEERLQWPSAFALDSAGYLWVVSNRLHNFLTRGASVDEPNYRIMKAFVGGSRPGDSSQPQPPMPHPEPEPEPEPSFTSTPRSTGAHDSYGIFDVSNNRTQTNYSAYNYTTYNTDHSMHDHSMHDHPHARAGASHISATTVMSFVVISCVLFL